MLENKTIFFRKPPTGFEAIRNLETDFLLQRMDEANGILKTIKLSTDIDGVVADTARPALDLVNGMLGTGKNKHDMCDFHTITHWMEEAGIKEASESAYKIWNCQDVVLKAPPESGSWIILRYLHQQGIDFKHITSRPEVSRNNTLLWYAKTFPWVNPEDIHIQKDGHDGTLFKAETIERLGINLHIEDSYDHLVSILKHTNAYVLYIPQPWNKKHIVHDKRVINVDRKYDELPKMAAAYFTLVDFVLNNNLNF